MENDRKSSRRRFLQGSVIAAGGLALGACGDNVSRNDGVKGVLGSAETLNRKLQRTLTGRKALAREYRPEDISTNFRANGSTHPNDRDYAAHVVSDFSDWRLAVDGLVDHPLSLSLDDLRAMPSRAQITRHDCVEGWSCIGKWKGARLSAVLDAAKIGQGARYVVFYCADTLGGAKYYESIDLFDAYHEQTILAYEMNDAPLTIPHGAPLRLRVERMLGYKHAKYVMRMALVDTLSPIGGGKGGYWEDRGYEWYAGI